MENDVIMTMRLPRRLRIEIRKHAAENDLPMQREIRRVLEAAYGLRVVNGDYVEEVAP